MYEGIETGCLIISDDGAVEVAARQIRLVSDPSIQELGGMGSPSEWRPQSGSLEVLGSCREAVRGLATLLVGGHYSVLAMLDGEVQQLGHRNLVDFLVGIMLLLVDVEGAVQPKELTPGLHFMLQHMRQNIETAADATQYSSSRRVVDFNDDGGRHMGLGGHSVHGDKAEQAELAVGSERGEPGVRSVQKLASMM